VVLRTGMLVMVMMVMVAGVMTIVMMMVMVMMVVMLVGRDIGDLKGHHEGENRQRSNEGF
jgi:hypothetical protein